jgi:hypothetical protein
MFRENANLADSSCRVLRGERSEGPVRPWWRPWWQEGLIVALLGVCLLAPVVTLMIYGLTTTGNAEEGVGRRYFYSLRILYGEHERPWAPQGQLVSVVHLAIQLVLTAVGFPPTQLFPRIDVFVQAVSILPIVLTVLAFIWAIRPITSPLAKLLIALGFLLVVFDSATTRGYHLVTPDYYSWVHAIALVGVGACLRVARSRRSLGLQSGCWLGAYAATAVSIKPTYLMFIMPLAIILLMNGVARRQWAGIGRGLPVSLAIVVVGTLAVYLAYYGGDIDALAQHVMNLTGFVDGIAKPMSFPAWLAMGLDRWHDGATLPVSIALVPLLMLSAVLLPNRAVSVGLLASAALNLYVAWRRYHPNTLIETNDYTFLAAVVGPCWLWNRLYVHPLVCSRSASRDGRGPGPLHSRPPA